MGMGVPARGVGLGVDIVCALRRVVAQCHIAASGRGM